MKIRAIIHDWDDTITNSFETYTQFYIDLGTFHHLTAPTQAELRKHWGGTIVDIVNGVWPSLTAQEAEEKTAQFIQQLKNWHKLYNATVFPQIKETIFKLDALGIKLGVISSGDSGHIKKLYAAQIHEELKPHCFFYDHKDLGCKKPDPRVFDKAVQQLASFGITEAETIYVGDGFQDYYAAKNRGLPFYAVTTGIKSKEDFIAEGLAPEYILDSFNDIRSVFSIR